jgi:hypothetical protein
VAALLVAAMLAPSLCIATTASVTLYFTAPGDDGAHGRASRYDIRLSRAPITEAGFLLLPPTPNLPTPSPAGTRERIVISGLVPGVQYWLALRTADEAGNWSRMSNVVALPITTTSKTDTLGAISFSPPAPNPARESVRFRYALPTAAHLRVEALDLSGRRVRLLLDAPREAGAGEVAWDLRDSQGQPVRAGVYLMRAQVGGRDLVQRLAVVR